MDVASSKPGCTLCATRFFTSTAHSHCHGFTLIELLAALAILIILAAVALPSIREFIDGQRKIAHINSMVSTLYLARSEAILRNIEVVVCKSSDGETCATSGEWEQGWLVFEDRNRDHHPDADEAILSRHEHLTGITLYYRGFSSYNYTVFRPQGRTNNGTFTFCDSSGSINARAVIVFKTGRVRTSNKRSDGSSLTCPP